MKIILTMALAFCLGACSQQGNRAIKPSRSTVIDMGAQPEEIQRFTVLKTATNSYHIVRIFSKEKPHYHENHDLFVTITKGNGKIHFRDRSEKIAPGDVIEIPRGSYHWAENLGSGYMQASVVFTPAFDGKDSKLIKE